jgi:hypothetical protein
MRWTSARDATWPIAFADYLRCRQHKVLAVSAAQATAEHDVLQSRSLGQWLHLQHHSSDLGAFAYHPNDKGMLAVSRALQAVLMSRKILPEQ